MRLVLVNGKMLEPLDRLQRHEKLTEVAADLQNFLRGYSLLQFVGELGTPDEALLRELVANLQPLPGFDMDTSWLLTLEPIRQGFSPEMVAAALEIEWRTCSAVAGPTAVMAVMEPKPMLELAQHYGIPLIPGVPLTALIIDTTEAHSS